MSGIITNLVIWLMKHTKFSLENRTKCVNALLDELNFIPYKDIITVNEQGRITVNGKETDFEQARQLVESSKALLNNYCRNIVQEQVAFRAVNIGVHNGDTPEKLYFSRVALWIYQQENDLLKELAQE